MEEFCYSERLACKLVAVDRSSYRYDPRPDRDGELRKALITLARQKPRYGYRRLWAVLSRRGHDVNVKRVYRLYRQAHLAVRRLKRKRLERGAPVNAFLTAANQEWGLDFMCDGVASGRGIRILTSVDGYTRECPALEVGVSVGSRRAGTSSPGASSAASRSCISSRGGRCRTVTWRASTAGFEMNV